MLNNLVIMGRLTKDPELRRTSSGVAVASFSIAVDGDYKDKDGNRKTNFFDCTAWRQTGEYICKYFTKGRMIVIRGSLDNQDWTDKEGNKRRSTSIIVDDAYFGDSRKDGEKPQGDQQTPQGGNEPPANGGFDVQQRGGYAAPQANNYGAPGGYGGYAAPGGYGGYEAPNPGGFYGGGSVDERF